MQKIYDGKIPCNLKKYTGHKTEENEPIYVDGCYFHSYIYGYGNEVLVDNTPFYAELMLKSFGRGRSSITFTFENETQTVSSEMFVSTFFDLCKSGVDLSKPIKGYWAHCKKGSNFGLFYLGETYNG